ncbi:hypothetical protein [Actinoplanes sp. DH11]|uniref:hypothetical protein n=1 Tax=Actinoplanes sp. DH11 TaxID=2857011 RepID=UPI001E42F6BD|nr:hypothetical protein [Actinoplanes sp. DH11]
MRPADLITAWERGLRRSPAGRAQALLEAAGVDRADGLALTVGQRDALLMDLRAELFGTRISGVAGCPACATVLELGFVLDDVRTVSPEPAPGPVEVTIEVDGYAVRARPPTGGDLVALEGAGPDRALRTLLTCCVVDAHHGGVTVGPDDLPPRVVSRLAGRLAAADPQADVRLDLTCPACARTWSAAFDIVTFLWRELDSWARRLAQDVHTLATAYGWAEVDIIAMSRSRRGLYLELARR